MRSRLMQNRLVPRMLRVPLVLAVVMATGCTKTPRETGSVRDTNSDSDLTTSEISPGRNAGLGERSYKSVAQKVVVQSARIKPGDMVLITGSEKDLPLLEDISIEVQKQGGSSLVSVGSAGLDRRIFDEVPAQYDTVTPKAMLKLAGLFDVFIGTESFEAATLKGVPPERLAARGKAFSGLSAYPAGDASARGPPPCDPRCGTRHGRRAGHDGGTDRADRDPRQCRRRHRLSLFPVESGADLRADLRRLA